MLTSDVLGNNPQPPLGSAWDDPATRRTLRRPLWWLRWLAVIGVVLVLSGVGFENHLNRQSDELLRTGTSVRGVVTSVEYRPKAGTFYRITYRTQHRIYVSVLHTDTTYTQGQSIRVVFDPAQPETFRTVRDRNLAFGSDSIATALLVLGVLILVLVGIGAVAVVSWRRRLRSSPWEPAKRLPDAPLRKTTLQHLQSASGRDVYIQLPGGRNGPFPLGDQVWILAHDKHSYTAAVRTVTDGTVRIGRRSAIPAKMVARRNR